MPDILVNKIPAKQHNPCLPIFFIFSYLNSNGDFYFVQLFIASQACKGLSPDQLLVVRNNSLKWGPGQCGKDRT